MIQLIVLIVFVVFFLSPVYCFSRGTVDPEKFFVLETATITATEAGLPYSEDSGLDYSFFLASRW